MESGQATKEIQNKQKTEGGGGEGGPGESRESALSLVPVVLHSFWHPGELLPTLSSVY